jgi:hypothetical protein
LSGFRFENRDEGAKGNVAGVFAPFFGGKPARCGTLGQEIQACLEFSICFYL